MLPFKIIHLHVCVYGTLRVLALPIQLPKNVKLDIVDKLETSNEITVQSVFGRTLYRLLCVCVWGGHAGFV